MPNARARKDQIDRSEFEVRLRTNRRTALVELFGELDLVSVAQVGEAFDSLERDADGLSHVVLDLRGLTFMDVTGIHELVRQRNIADRHRRNLTVIRGPESINRLMAITAVDTLLVLVEHPEDLLPPPPSQPPTPLPGRRVPTGTQRADVRYAGGDIGA